MKTNKLTTASLVWMFVGGSIGVGLMSVTGAAADKTGYSVWLAFIVASVLGLLASWPIIFAAGTDTLDGAMFELNAKYTHPIAGALYTLGVLVNITGQAAVALGIGNYLHTLCEYLPIKPTAIICTLLFYLLSIRGMDAIAKVQKYMVYLLLAGLGVFTVIGLKNLNPDATNFTAPTFFNHGLLGFAVAVNLLSFSTQGYFSLLSFSRYTHEPKKTLPRAMLIGFFIIMAVYGVVTLAGVGGVDLDTFAGKTLGDVAKAMMPRWLFVLFVVTSPLMALVTTLNSNITSFAMIIEPAAAHGWLPKFLAKRNRYQMPYLAQTLVVLLILLPLILDWDTSFITSNAMLFINLTYLLQYFGVWMLPKKFPELWENSRFHMPKGWFHVLMAASLAIRVVLLASSFASVTGVQLIVNILLAIALSVYCVLRYRSGRVVED